MFAFVGNSMKEEEIIYSNNAQIKTECTKVQAMVHNVWTPRKEFEKKFLIFESRSSR